MMDVLALQVLEDDEEVTAPATGGGGGSFFSNTWCNAIPVLD